MSRKGVSIKNALNKNLKNNKEDDIESDDSYESDAMTESDDDESDDEEYTNKNIKKTQNIKKNTKNKDNIDDVDDMSESDEESDEELDEDEDEEEDDDEDEDDDNEEEEDDGDDEGDDDGDDDRKIRVNKSKNKKGMKSEILTEEEAATGDINLDDIFSTTTSSVKKRSERVTKPFLTKYEYVKILSIRTQQLANSAKRMILNTQGLTVKQIAILEIKNKTVPLIIKRPVPNQDPEYWKLSELENFYIDN